MIKPHVNCKSQPLWHYVTQYLLCCRKRRHVTSCYSSHGLFYVLIILIYGSYLLNSPYGILAQQLNELQLMITSLSNDSNNSEAFNASKSSKNNEKLAVAAAAIAEAVKMDNGNTYEEYFDDDLDKEYEDLINNKSARGMYIGAPCDVRCNSKLHHVTCDKATKLCTCEKRYPVMIGLVKGCAKPKKLGEQCFYEQTCMYNDANSLCVQVRHNALCQCKGGFHSVSYLKPTKRVFCTEDMSTLTSDLPTLLGVSTGIAVLTGLICMVLHLFTKTKYPRQRSFGDANLPPPIMYSSDTGSRRPSLASIHSTSSSIRSYSTMRFEKELQQKELRQEMKLRLTRLHQQQHLLQNKPHIIISESLINSGAIPKTIALTTPSPITPNSLDELLPSVSESQEPSTPILLEKNKAYVGPFTNENLLD